ncbi:hypothetical protein M404DRAFT_516253 [Pisolithus tinctorius Marx 270]|uniref:Uncharacterized protein n=1 Tax=Pisolithus tinctorius Marx 270 TaxID=870435 RepID=A0A0C3MWQ4_PISTI|nr:hypothetical protein M404DRAFT_516253 [Pisolithus tinctorius Marx 270]
MYWIGFHLKTDQSMKGRSHVYLCQDSWQNDLEHKPQGSCKQGLGKSCLFFRQFVRAWIDESRSVTSHLRMTSKMGAGDMMKACVSLK